MSKLTETSRLKVEDFQEQRKWIAPLLESYNNFLTQSIRLLNGGLLFRDNVVGLDYDFDFTFQTQAISFPQKVKWPFDRLTPRHVYSTYASEQGIPIIAVFSWRFSDDRFIEILQVSKVTSVPALGDLVAASKYKLRVRAEP